MRTMLLNAVSAVMAPHTSTPNDHPDCIMVESLQWLWGFLTANKGSLVILQVLSWIEVWHPMMQAMHPAPNQPHIQTA